MKKFWKDPVALSFAAAGVMAMVFTLIFHINPVEGSVVPQFLREHPIGIGIHWVLFVTCMPSWIAGTALVVALLGESNLQVPLTWLSEWLDAGGLLALILQAITFFLLGKLAGGCWRHRSGRGKGLDCERP